MWRRWCSLLDHTDGGAEGSVVLQPVQEGSDSLRQRRLQLRDVALELKTGERRVTTCPVSRLGSASPFWEEQEAFCVCPEWASRPQPSQGLITTTRPPVCPRSAFKKDTWGSGWRAGPSGDLQPRLHRIAATLQIGATGGDGNARLSSSPCRLGWQRSPDSPERP